MGVVQRRQDGSGLEFAASIMWSWFLKWVGVFVLGSSLIAAGTTGSAASNIAFNHQKCPGWSSVLEYGGSSLGGGD